MSKFILTATIVQTLKVANEPDQLEDAVRTGVATALEAAREELQGDGVYVGASALSVVPTILPNANPNWLSVLLTVVVQVLLADPRQ
jgi:hypothetical protein